MRANFRVAAHFLGHCEGPLKQLVQVRAKGVRLLSHTRGIFHLPQDLRLAQDHGVQARGHPKRMAHRVCVGQRVQMFFQTRRRADAVAIGYISERIKICTVSRNLSTSVQKSIDLKMAR
jgi:hypothetical protein